MDGGSWKGERTARIKNSMNALCWERDRKDDIAAAQDEVSSVVVLDNISISLSVPSHPQLLEDWGDPTVSQRLH